VEGIDVMNSFLDTEPGIQSELIDLDNVSFTTLRELDNAALRRSLGHVAERTTALRVPYRSTNAGGGERID
jgi:hypothetical protein